MSELAPMTTELAYSAYERDAAEERLALEANKKELLYRKSNGIEVIAYWHKAEDTCSLYVYDERTKTASEFPISNEEVMDWFDHPFSHPDAMMPQYTQNQNGETDGA